MTICRALRTEVPVSYVGIGKQRLLVRSRTCPPFVCKYTAVNTDKKLSVINMKGFRYIWH
jgi:hypothetical protein